MHRALILFVILFGAVAFAPKQSRSATQDQQKQTSPPQTPAKQAPPPQPGAPPMAQPMPALRTIVLDPGHGGEDTGARGPTGTAEKDVVLEWAQVIASSLRAEGFQVVLTRTGDTNPSLDDRDTTANAQSDAIFISLHVGSTGTPATVRTYSYLFPLEPPPAPANPLNAAQQATQAPPAGFLLWREAQKSFVTQSVKLGDLIQVELAQKFKGSPEISSAAPVAVLRSVAAPAVAVEVSNIGADASQLESMSADLASCIARAAAAYKTIYLPEPR